MYYQIDFSYSLNGDLAKEVTGAGSTKKQALKALSDKLVNFLQEDSGANALLDNERLTCLQINWDTKLEEHTLNELEQVLHKAYPQVLFLIVPPNYINQKKINTNFAGNYLRKEPQVETYRVREAEQLYAFLKKNRVVVLEEKEGCEHRGTIGVAIEEWQKEEKRILPLFFNEQLQSYHEAFAAIYSFLTEIYDTAGLKEQLELLKTTQEKLDLLTSMLHEHCQPVFIFENISPWFDATGKPYYPYRDVTDWLYKLAGNGGEYLIITTKNIAGEIARLPRYLTSNKNFSDYKSRLFAILQDFKSNDETLISNADLKIFYEITDGSEVALDLGVWLHLNQRVSLKLLIANLKKYEKCIRLKHFFQEVMPFLPESLLSIYQLLSAFQVPVSVDAFHEFLPELGKEEITSLCNEAALIVKYQDSEKQLHYCLHPACRAFFSKVGSIKVEYKALADWHASQLNEPQRGLAHLKEAYRHYNLCEDKKGILDTGAALNMHYFKAGNLPVSHHYGIACYQKFEGDLPQSILNCLGLVFRKYKKAEEALFFFKILHEKQEGETPNKKHVKVLNYLSMLSFELEKRQDYVQYGLKAYKLALELKETKEVYMLGMTLGRFLYVAGKKEGGLKMMQQSYQIGVSKGYADVGVLEMFLRSMGEM